MNSNGIGLRGGVVEADLWDSEGPNATLPTFDYV